MARHPNTNRFGRAWSDQTKKEVWEKGLAIPEYSPEIWRWDKYASPMKWSDFGDRKSKYGWEIDHVKPVIHAGNDSIDNLQPLNWKNNAEKGDLLNWKSLIKS
jgi:5-methylcytosine-specific restriction endonuclease McrA